MQQAEREVEWTGWRWIGLLIFALCGLGPAAAGASPPADEVVLPWGRGPGQVGLLEAPDGRWGPQALAICGAGDVLLLDSLGKRLIRLDSALVVTDTVPLGFVALDVAASGDCSFVARSADDLSRHLADGSLVERTSLPSELRFVSNMRWVADGRVALEESHSRTYEVGMAGEPSIAAVRPGVPIDGRSVQVELAGAGAVRLLYFREDGAPERTLDVPLKGEELASVRLVGADAWGRLVLDVERFVSTSPVEVSRSLLAVAEDGAPEWSLELPGAGLVHATRDVALSLDGTQLLAMIAGSDGLHVLRWDLSPNSGESLEVAWTGLDGLSSTTLAPDVSEAAVVSPLAAGPLVTRPQVLATADTYVRYAWTAASCNVGSRSCSGKTAITPSWVTPGPHTQVAYKWGGFSSLADYGAGLGACLLAGDRVTENGAAACAVGVDCSGFVSRCWATTSKYGTATLHQVSYEIGPNEMLPGDVYNKSGSHVRMLVSRNSNGTLNMVESYAGADYWRVGYTVRTLSDNTGYISRRYANIDDDHGPRPGSPEAPIPIQSAGFTDTNTTAGGPSDMFDTYSCAPQTNEAGPEVLYLLRLSAPATVTVAVSDGSAVDVDPHLLSALDSGQCIARNDVSFGKPGLSAGDYYVVADTWVNASGEQLAGPYELTVQVDPPSAVDSDAEAPAVSVYDQGLALTQAP